MSYSLGSKQLTLEDVARLSTSCEPLKLDEAAVHKLDERFPKTSLPVAKNQGSIVRSFKDFPIEVRRGALIVKAYALIHGQSPVRSALVQLLVDLLNRQFIPLFSSFEKAGEDLVRFLQGNGKATSRDGQIVEASIALAEIGVSEFSLLELEASAILKHPFLLIGYSTLVIYGANELLKTIDCVAALSVEAKGSSAEGFDSIELFRQHRGQITSATNLKTLLEGSKVVGSAKDLDPSFAVLHNIPLVHGPCHETIAAAVKSIEIELNSYEIAPLNPSIGLTADSTQSLILAQNVGNALLSLLLASQNRIKLLTGTETHVVYENDETLKPLHFLRSLTASLAQELTSSWHCLFSKEKALREAHSTTEKSSEGKQKQSKDLSEMDLTPAEREKIEAKRRAKAQKAAEKAAAKEQRKSGLVLGVGTASVRAVITKALPFEEPPEDFNVPQFAASLSALLDPFRLSSDSFANKFSAILESLTAGGKRKPKLPKGTRDYSPDQMRIREHVFSSIRQVFKRHGGVEIDTPVFELKEVLMGKYGEDSKLIYDLADQGGELLSLRYDLTVPFARFLAMNSVGNIKRYHIAKVYRRDQPQLNRGRYREFYQCDFDVAGQYPLMVPDAEVITIAHEILSSLPIGSFLIKLSHRKLLDAIFDICGVPAEKFRSICSAVDKLDKLSWEEVKSEMVLEKGLSEEIADKISIFVLNRGQPMELWSNLMDRRVFGDHPAALQAMEELKLLFDYLEAMDSIRSISFDLSLARGLDYYTGVIYEAVLVDGVSQVGSIAAGGRYDNLVGMFNANGVQTPCVGISIGVERVFTILEKKAESADFLQRSTIQVYVASIGCKLIDRMRIAKELWQNNFSAEFNTSENPKFKKQLDEVLERGIPYLVILGEDELKQGTVKVKDMRVHREVLVPQTELIATLRNLGCEPLGSSQQQRL